MLSTDDAVRAIQIGALGFVAIWLAIMFGRACWWPFYWRLEPHGGLISFLRGRLGAFMWPVILISMGLVGFLFALGAGVVWLSLRVISEPPITQATVTPNTVGNPDFSLLAPQGRYRFTWPAERFMSFYLRHDTEKIRISRIIPPLYCGIRPTLLLTASWPLGSLRHP
jgi:hypothetical protein